MKDRFRFRVWNKEKEGYKKATLDSTDLLFGKYFCCADIYDEKKFIIEQCTGLKDKKGKLIYEGDIISAITFAGHNRQFIVKYAEEDACFGLLATNKLYYGFAPYECENFEVIGNIHEDSHLLENSNNLC